MDEINTLDIFLYEKKIGTITQLPGDRNFFTFSEEYSESPVRPTLSLSFKDQWGHLITNIKSTRTRLPPFFSNLLPEGSLRDYLASQAKVGREREFFLLQALGYDLAGAITVKSSTENPSISKLHNREEESFSDNQNDGILHFSLAGIQIKFSALWEKGKRLTIPMDGIGGSWIIKMPSPSYPGVPENEYAMMSLARQMKIDTPDTALIPIEQIVGLPKAFKKLGNMVYAVRRFDRGSNKEKIHIEDLAQVFGVYPEKKYSAASYRNIGEVIWAETGEEGTKEFIRRFVFNALIGNGDMHLKNWSFIYPDKKRTALAPAYDFVSTIPYLPEDKLALNFVDSKEFTSLTTEQFKRFAAKGKLQEGLVLDTMQETVREFKKIWKFSEDLPIEKTYLKIIEDHFKTIPIYKETT